MMMEIDHAEGCWLYDKNGKKYLDLISGISVSNLGHNNAVVKNAIHVQLDKYMHVMVYGEFIETPQVQFAKYLSDLLPENLSSVYFVNSGTEAVEGALKLAKRFSGRTEIISFANSYHGSTLGALSLGNTEERKNSFRPLIPDNKILEFNNFDQIENISEKTAAVIMEPVQAEAGIILPKDNYLFEIRKRCSEKNVLLIFDECQTGMGRTGKLFAFEKYHVIPDILCLGKALGGGMPLGAFISSEVIMHTLTNHPVLGHLTTFGGHPVCCAAGLAAAQELMNLNLTAGVSQKAQLFKQLLVHPKIKSIRNAGLLISIEFEIADFNLSLINRLVPGGLLVDWFLFADNCMRLAPPLIISDEEIKHACSIILNGLKK